MGENLEEKGKLKWRESKRYVGMQKMTVKMRSIKIE